MYSIIEVANTHGGNLEYLNSLIDEFSELSENVGIKFQPFKYNEIALPDFAWYPVYEKLYFDENQWEGIIFKANNTKDVWLDLSDCYSVKILANNLKNVVGVKLQTSILNNYVVLNELKKLNLTEKKIIVNVAGREIENVKEIIEYFENSFDFEEILIEVGFQAYPTDLIDSGISKIKLIKEQFINRIVFADHVNGKEIHSKILPIIATMMGADVIEKHVMHSTRDTEYDHFSSINANEFKEVVKLIDDYKVLYSQPFINKKETEYLKNSIQVPVLNIDINKDGTISISDFNYKRTSLTGVDFYELQHIIEQGYVKLDVDKKKDELITKNDLSKVKVACIIAARLKSSRLKDKAKLKIGKLSSVELCIKNSLSFKNVDLTVLATSTNKQDSELANYKYSDDVYFHTGDAEDVIQRYLDVIRKENIDVFIRVTGDMPYVSEEIASFLLKEHFKSGADYTIAKAAAVGTNLEIINSSALEKVKTHFTSANYSEYMSWYFQNNPEHFKLNFVDLPNKWVRDYRLTIDYQEDLDMFNKIEEHFENKKIKFTIGDLFHYLDNNPGVAKMNAHMELTYKTDKKLIETLHIETKIK